MEKNIFCIGEKVIYKNNSGKELCAIIKEIHYDDIEPYYSIKIKNYKEERQTIIDKLKKIKQITILWI